MKVNIIIPCYNHGEFLKEAVESALKSTFKNYEIIIVNDGSTDVSTLTIIKELERKFQHNKLINFIHQENLGLANARNNGIRTSKGEYILILDADNKIRPDYLSEAVEIIIERAKEKYPDVRPTVISDNGPQFIARDFKEFIRISGMSHVRTSPFYPQSNGKLERWHKTLKHESIRPNCPVSKEDAVRIVREYVEHYNNTSS